MGKRAALAPANPAVHHARTVPENLTALHALMGQADQTALYVLTETNAPTVSNARAGVRVVWPLLRPPRRVSRIRRNASPNCWRAPVSHRAATLSG